jgi:acetyl-CoA carboxylase biotin carboxyl carrier protein
MNQKEIKELIEFLKEQDIDEFELERGDVKVRIKRAVPGMVVPAHDPRMHAPVPEPQARAGVEQPVVPVAPAVPPAIEVPSAPPEKLHSVRSPIVGTFYESPSPGAPPFVKPGDVVEVGQLLCIVEAMKLMNEIESDVAGEIVKKFLNNGQPIEYGQELFTIRPRT